MPQSKYKNGEQRMIGVIGDEDTCTGFLLAGVGDKNPKKGLGPNFFVVEKNTKQGDIEEGFRSLVSRDDIAVILICQHIANDIRYLIDEHSMSKEPLPCILEIPSKQIPFDGSKDPVLSKLRMFLGEK